MELNFDSIEYFIDFLSKFIRIRWIFFSKWTLLWKFRRRVMMFRPRLRIAHRLPFPFFVLLPPSLTISTYSSDFSFYSFFFFSPPPLPHTAGGPVFPLPFSCVWRGNATAPHHLSLPEDEEEEKEEKGRGFVDECKGKRESTEWMKKGKIPSLYMKKRNRRGDQRATTCPFGVIDSLWNILYSCTT